MSTMKIIRVSMTDVNGNIIGSSFQIPVRHPSEGAARRWAMTHCSAPREIRLNGTPISLKAGR